MAPDLSITLNDVMQTEAGVSGSVRFSSPLGREIAEGPVTEVEVEGATVTVSGIFTWIAPLPGGIGRYDITFEITEQTGSSLELKPLRFVQTALFNDTVIREVTAGDEVFPDTDIDGTVTDCD